MWLQQHCQKQWLPQQPFWEENSCTRPWLLLCFKAVPKLPVHLRNYRDKFERNAKVRQAFKDAQESREILATLNEALGPGSEADDRIDAEDSPRQTRKWPPKKSWWCSGSDMPEKGLARSCSVTVIMRRRSIMHVVMRRRLWVVLSGSCQQEQPQTVDFNSYECLIKVLPYILLTLSTVVTFVQGWWTYLSDVRSDVVLSSTTGGVSRVVLSTTSTV